MLSMPLTVGDLVEYLKGVPGETPVVVEAPMPGSATLFVDDPIVGHGERGDNDEIVIFWHLDAASVVGPSS